jgi:hypothetical protein
MQNLLKRWKLIQSCIELNDLDIIELQIAKLQQYKLEEEAGNILILLQNKDFGAAALRIDKYIERSIGIKVYQDQELLGLKLELKALEQQIQKLSVTRDSFAQDIDNFQLQYQLRLGALITAILQREKEILKENFKRIEQEFEDAKKEYQKTRTELIELKQLQEDIEQKLEGVDEFGDEYNEIYEELKDIRVKKAELEKILEEKRKRTIEVKSNLEKNEDRQQYEKVEEDYKKFHEEYEEAEKQEQKKNELTEDEKKELKELFRKGAKLSHPDIVPDDQKEKAKAVMQDLNEAYKIQDLVQLAHIVAELEAGGAIASVSDAVDDKDVLREKIIQIRQRICEIEKEIEQIKNDILFQIISDLESWDSYFDAQERALKDKMDHLNDDANEYIVRENPVTTQKDVYWEEEF